MENNQLNILLNKLLNSSTRFVKDIDESAITFVINNHCIDINILSEDQRILYRNESINSKGRYFNLNIPELGIYHIFEDMSLKEFAIFLERFNDIINDFRYDELTNIITKIDNSSIHASNVDDIDV